MSQVTFTGNVVDVEGKQFRLLYPIKEAFALADKVIVLFDADANLGRQGQFKNLIALSRTGELLWTAELPTDKPSDVYYRIISRLPLKADSFCSFECEIDPTTGKIRHKEFFK